MKKILLLFSAIALQYAVSAQCNVTADASEYEITCGDSVILSHAGSVAGNTSFHEDFNSGSATGWAFTQQATFTNPCSPGGVDGTTHIWMGDQSGVPRSLETLPLNFGPAVAPAGGTICFDMLFAEQGDGSPCEGPDEPDEGVYLQYSTDNGATWITIHYFDPNGGNDPDLVNWNNWCFPIPAGALINGVKFRWFQDADSGAEYDHWGIDNVEIIVNDPNVTYTWAHDGYTTNLPGSDPTPVYPTETTTYTVTMTTTSNGSCSQDITITVIPPVFEINLGNDTTICPGECVTLNATAYEVVSPASTPTFSNSQVGIITGTPAVPFLGDGTINASMNINVQGLNSTTVGSGSITNVCITGLSVTPGFGCTGTSLNNISLVLVCPDGTEVILAPNGTLSGTTITNMCFSLSAPSYTTGSSPYTGTFSPANSWTALNGCSSNGVWIMKIVGINTQTCVPIGSLSGWSISFDDPEITAPITYSWSPTTDMTNSTTLSPTICPSATQTYTLTVEDTDHCATESKDIAITIGTCCALTIEDVPTVNPDCSTNNGQITINHSGETTGLQFSIDGGTTFQSSNVFSGLAAGTYNIQIIDDADCPDNMQVVLSNPNAPVVSANTTDPHCGNSDGSIEITTTGGTPTMQYSIDGGTTFQSSATFSNLSADDYDIVVTDGNGCQATHSVTLTDQPGPSITNVAQTVPNCGATDGGLVVTATGGTGALTYSIDNGTTTQATGTFNNLGAGTYDIVVEDANGCQATQSVILNNGNGPSISDVTITAPTCGSSNGGIVVTASGGSGSLTYSIDNGTTTQASGSFSNLPAGTYDIVVEDANGCQATDQAILTTTNLPNVNAGSDITICEGESVTLSGSGAVTYTWDNGVTNGTPFTPGATTTYTVTGTDANGCTNVDVVTVTVTPTPDASFTPSVTSGNPVLTVVFTNNSTSATSYVWDFGNGTDLVITNSNGNQTGTFSTPGVYNVVLTAANGPCTDDFTLPITVVGFPPVDIHIPNVFTPNGDGDNDEFFIAVTNGSTIDVQIVNRWGNPMFRIQDFTTKWDGKEASDGVYFFIYKITGMDGKAYEGHGNITLIRE